MVWRFKHMLDDLEVELGSQSKVADFLGIERGQVYSYQVPTKEGPSLATLGRIAHKRRQFAKRLLLPSEAQGGAIGATMPVRFMDLSPEQMARLAELVGSWDDAGVTDDAIKIAEEMTRHLLPVPEKEN